MVNLVFGSEQNVLGESDDTATNICILMRLNILCPTRTIYGEIPIAIVYKSF